MQQSIKMQWIHIVVLAAILYLSFVSNLKEGVSGGVEAQLGAGTGLGFGSRRGSSGGQIVPANAAWSNIDAYGGQSISNPGGGGYSTPPSTNNQQQGYGPSAGAGVPSTTRGPYRGGTRSDEAYLRYRVRQAETRAARAEQALTLQGGLLSRLFGWIFGPR